MTKRFEEGKRRTKADTQTRLYIKKNESSRNEKKAMGRFGVTKKKRKEQDESDTGDKNKVEGVVQKWLVLFAKSLNNVANLDQITCKKKKIKGKLG